MLNVSILVNRYRDLSQPAPFGYEQLALGRACIFHLEPVRWAKAFSWGFWKKEFLLFLCIFLQLFGGNLGENGGSSEETWLRGKKEEIQSRGYLIFLNKHLCSAYNGPGTILSTLQI